MEQGGTGYGTRSKRGLLGDNGTRERGGTGFLSKTLLTQKTDPKKRMSRRVLESHFKPFPPFHLTQ